MNDNQIFLGHEEIIYINDNKQNHPTVDGRNPAPVK